MKTFRAGRWQLVWWGFFDFDAWRFGTYDDRVVYRIINIGPLEICKRRSSQETLNP